jgi:hypothetical protein
MTRVRFGAVIAAVFAVSLTLGVFSPSPLNDSALLESIEEFERALDGQPREVIQQSLREQAEAFKGRAVTVRSATVASTYIRENASRVYFGFNYEPGDHLYLSEIDPSLDERLANHRHWVSVVKTSPSRQVSFELPVSEQDFGRLDEGTEISFTCRIAALIRGRSVYCDARGLFINR